MNEKVLRLNSNESLDVPMLIAITLKIIAFLLEYT